MADHGDNYHPSLDDEGKYIGSLSDDCGHHCGIITTGSSRHVGHCNCKECHGDPFGSTGPFREVDPRFTNQNGSVDPRGIR